jgi:ABC-2 type transport system ATP-binding protein
VKLGKSGKLIFRVAPTKVPVESVMDAVRAAGYKIIDLTTKESDLEDIFLLMTGGDNKGEKIRGER